MDTENKMNYKVGKNIPTWNLGKAQTITFIVTEDCNLRCKYCYITHKSSNKKMNLNIAQKFINLLLQNNIDKQEAVIIEFIGGEPFLEIELISQIVNYFKIITFEKNVTWYWNYRINISTNGINYADIEVQKFILQNLNKISVSITIDGTKEKHDLNRLFPNSYGSYDIVKKNIPLYISQMRSTTKVTFSSDDLKYLKESVISLWNLGITDIAANVVFEDVWKENDDKVFEEQLMDLANYIIENQLHNNYYCTLFSDSIGQPNDEESLNSTYCGAGKMIALGPDGKIYPCLRYKDYSLNHNKEWIIGTVEDGIDMEKVRPFVAAMTRLQSTEKCINCNVATGCAFCQGFNYDQSETSTIFSRATFICKMHKARVRANNYYFELLYNRFGIVRENYDYSKKNKLFILLSDDFVSFCEHKNNKYHTQIIDRKTLISALDFSNENFFFPVLIHSETILDYYDEMEFEGYHIQHIIPAKFYKNRIKFKDYVVVFDKTNYDLICDKMKECTLIVNLIDILNLSKYVIKLFDNIDHINVYICDLNNNFDELEYEKQLIVIKDYLIMSYYKLNKMKTINLITDLCYLKEFNNCKAGDSSYTLDPNGKIYICPAFYSLDLNSYIGDLDKGLSKHKNKHLYTLDYRPICSVCDAKQCHNCIYINVISTNEVNISPSYQCRKSHIERRISRQYQIEMKDQYENIIQEVSYLDPIDIFINTKKIKKGYYNNYKD